MFTNRFSRIFIVVLVLASALTTVSFAAHSANIPTTADRSYDLIEGLRAAASAQVDRSYDAVEQLRASRPNTFTAFSYDQIEALRAQRGVVFLTVRSSYDAVEQVRLSRAFSADRAYDQVEALRLSR